MQEPANPEWYADFATLKPLLQQELTYTDSILVLSGPQASNLHEDLYDSGYRGLTAVHSSSSLIQSWRQKHTGSRPTLNYQAADIAEGLAFEHLPYAAIIDKGTIDGLLCKEAGMEEAQTALLNVWSILKSPGSFIWFTHGPPSLRMPLISQQKWSGVTVRVIMPAGTATAAAGAAAGAPVSAPAGAAAKTAGPVRLQVANMDPDAVYPDTATYVYICKKPYV